MALCICWLPVLLRLVFGGILLRWIGLDLGCLCSVICLALFGISGLPFSIPQGCPLNMMFIAALYLPWCRYLAAHEGVEPQLYADNLTCVSRDPNLLLRAAR